MHLKFSSWDDSCLGKLCGFLLCGQQTCVCGWIVQEQPGWLCQCFGGVQGSVCECTVLQSFFSSQRCIHGLQWQALFSTSEDCRGALAHLSLLLRCSYLFLAENQVC